MTDTMPKKPSGNDLEASNSPSGPTDTRTAPKPPQITCSCGAGMLMPHFLDLDPKRAFYPPGPDGDEEWADAVAGVKAVRMDRAIDATLLALPYELVSTDASVRSLVEEAVTSVGGDEEENE